MVPATARPIPKPTIPCSQSGVLKTRSLPYRSRRPLVHLNTPPNPTSSPNTTKISIHIQLNMQK